MIVRLKDHRTTSHTPSPRTIQLRYIRSGRAITLVGYGKVRISPFAAWATLSVDSRGWKCLTTSNHDMSLRDGLPP